MRTFLSSLLLSLLSTASLVACGGGAGPSAVTAESAEADCRTWCEHDVACTENPETSVDACVADCVDDVAGWTRGDALEDFVACVDELACSQGEAACVSSCEPLEAHEAYETACRAGFGDCLDPSELDGMCEVTPAGGQSDVGFLLCLVAPEIIDEMTACFDDGAACQAAFDCVGAVAEAHGVDL